MRGISFSEHDARAVFSRRTAMEVSHECVGKVDAGQLVIDPDDAPRNIHIEGRAAKGQGSGDSTRSSERERGVKDIDVEELGKIRETIFIVH